MCLAGSIEFSHVESELKISVFKTLFCDMMNNKNLNSEDYKLIEFR